MLAAPEKFFTHETVLLNEAVEALNVHDLRRDGIYIDATFGRGGHARAILQNLSAQGRLLVFDKDPEAIQNAQLIDDPRLSIAHKSFQELAEHLSMLDIANIDGVLFDLGVSSPQFDNANRGFSFRMKGPLDMRMDPTQGLSAKEWLAKVSEETLAKVIFEYGEERFARKIARAIVEFRAHSALTETTQLADLIQSVVKRYERGQHPATRTFQAIRIYINQELDELKAALSVAFNRLAPEGRLVVISFHSLEDRIVKHFMQQHSKTIAPARGIAILEKDLKKPSARVFAKCRPSVAEISRNPRARSAIMRTLEKQA